MRIRLRRHGLGERHSLASDKETLRQRAAQALERSMRPAAGSDHVAHGGGRTRRNLEHALGALPGLTARIFIAHRLEGQSYAEIADSMGIEVPEIERHMAAALRQLLDDRAKQRGGSR